MAASGLNQPHGGSLVNVMATKAEAAMLRKEALRLPSWDLAHRQECDLELLLNGAFSPLQGFHDRQDYSSVVDDMRLLDGTVWPIPISLDVTQAFVSKEKIAPGSRIALRHAEGMVLAVMTVSDVWRPDRKHEAQNVLGTRDEAHPGVFGLFHETNPIYLGGRVEGIEAPPHHTFDHLRWTPAALRRRFQQSRWSRIVAFQTRNPMHRAHVALADAARKEAKAKLLIHPVVGRTGPGDLDYFTRVRCYQAVLKRLPRNSARLALLPLAMRMGGPREAVWHAIIRKNFGASHFIIGRDHAGPRNRATGRAFYQPYAAQELAQRHEQELGIKIVAVEDHVYVESRDAYVPRSAVRKSTKVLSLSGTDLRRRLRTGEDVPEWFTFPEVATELRRLYVPPPQQGFTVFFTGLPSSGKSTVAKTLAARLMELGPRAVTLLDGDVVRKNLSSELGFSREHRDLNVQRIGFVASEITKNGGVAICAPIAPYEKTRRQVREGIEQGGGFVLVHISTPLAVCEKRDRKGLYAKARAGLIKEFTGVNDPYEKPKDAQLTIDTTDTSPEDAVRRIVRLLRKRRFLSPANATA